MTFPTALVLVSFQIILQPGPDQPMCKLYFQTKSQDAMRHMFDDILIGDNTFTDLTGKLPAQTGIWPDNAAPTIRHRQQRGWQPTKASWGMPTPDTSFTQRR